MVMEAFQRYDHGIRKHSGDGEVEGERHTRGGAPTYGEDADDDLGLPNLESEEEVE